MDIYTIVGEQLFDFVGPFDEAESPAGEIVFGSEVIGFFDFVEPVAIEVVDEFAGSSGPVFVDNGECGTIDGVVTPSSSQTALMKVVFPAPMLP